VEVLAPGWKVTASVREQSESRSVTFNEKPFAKFLDRRGGQNPTLDERPFGKQSFDTGYPVDFAWLRQTLGPEVEVLGGPTVMLLRHGTPEQVAAEVRRILDSGIREGGRFVLREANNLPPGVPTENLWAMYEACRRYS
jgi:hypothetical protein